MDPQLIRAIESVGEPNWTGTVQAIAAFSAVCVGFVGFLLVWQQLEASRDTLKAQVLLKLFDDWRKRETYESMAYVNRLREKWKKDPGCDDWHKLARQWVAEHANSKETSDELWQEQIWRRTASQFLAKMGALVQAGYLTPDEFFRVDPEVGRQLAVLAPIEIATKERFLAQEGERVAEWDTPFPKWEFKQLQEDYEVWFKTVGHTLVGGN